MLYLLSVKTYWSLFIRETYRDAAEIVQVYTMQTLSEEGVAVPTTGAVGVIKVNSRILEAHELKKLDKSEKSLVNAIHVTGKGKMKITFLY